MPEPEAATSLGEIDPKKISKEEFAERLRSSIEARGHDENGHALASLQPEQFARLISRASSSQLESIMAPPELREPVIDEVFRRMSEHYKADKARNTEAVVRWRIGYGDRLPDDHRDGDQAKSSDPAEDADQDADGDYLRYECLLSGGTCTVSRQYEREPRVTIMVSPVDFLKLASGNSSAPTMFLTGKIKVAGDLGFAAGLTKLFQIPKA